MRYRLSPKVSYVNYHKLYPQTGAFKKWFVVKRFWSKMLWVVGIRHHFVKLDWRRDWVRDMLDV